MALTDLHPINESVVYCHSASVGSTPINAATRAPFRGRIIKVGCVLHSGISTSNLLVSTLIAGTTVTGGGFNVTASNSVAGTMGTAVPTAANTCNEDDAIIFTPTVAAGTTVPATFFAVVRRV